MKKLFTLALLLAVCSAYSQSSETHNFITYDTTYNGPFGSWMLRISRPNNMFTAGSADTASRPAIITMPGVGEMGNTDPNHLTTYGPHYWMLNGWDGSVILGNGKHYPVLITVTFATNPYPTPEGGADVLSFILSHYHIKRNSVHLAGLSMGAYTWSAMIAYEKTAGDETGMKMTSSLTCLEGFTVAQDAPYSNWSRGTGAYGVWASKYHGRFFGLEGNSSDNFRDVWIGSQAMNASVPGSAYFSYEGLGGGGHCCWNSMYDPSATNWTSVGTLGPNNSPSQVGQNSMGTYKAPSSIFQWMLRQGDTSIVGAVTSPSGPSLPLSTYTPVPGTVQGESYSGMSGVQTQPTTDNGGGLDVGWIDNGDWMDYNINVAAAGVYTVNFRVASPYDGASLQVQDAAGKSLAVVAISNTGDFQKWATVTANVTLPAGQQKIRISSNSGADWNFNWVQFISGASSIGKSIPGTIQAESFDAMSGVETQSTADNGAGLNVGWIDNGDWMDYNVNVAAAGVYTVNFRVASPNNGASLQLQDGAGKLLALVPINNTGDFQNWATVTANVTLSAGQQKIRISSNSGADWNFNWVQFITGASGAAKSIPGTIQAESYDAMSGVQTQPTTDNGGGTDVGWIDNGDWMDYNVNVAAAGVYTVNFRIASPYNGASLQLQDAAGKSLAVVAINNTGDFQKWATVTARVTLPAGLQKVRISNNSGADWNINWIQFTAGTGTSALAEQAVNGQATGFLSDSAQVPGEYLRIYPNPVRDRVALNISNRHTGKMIVQVISPSGSLLQTYTFDKELQTMQVELGMGNLPAGIYIVRVVGADWGETRKVVKW